MMYMLQIEGVNGTFIANQYVRDQRQKTVRTLISLDNGGNWELVRSPASANCIPPQCSLHFHMTTSDYARTGVYSQVRSFPHASPSFLSHMAPWLCDLSPSPSLFRPQPLVSSWHMATLEAPSMQTALTCTSLEMVV